MFGPNDSQQDGGTNGMMPPAQPNDNSGGYGMPAPGTPAPSSTQPMGDDASMPPADELAASSDQSSPRDMHAQTPEELISIKQDALQSLKPLIGHLDQSAEERFRTTMMMIQASDDQSMIPDAYEAAKAIEDEKVRAQALLDVVNEINYFTQAANKQ